jgi:hypothetical protein
MMHTLFYPCREAARLVSLRAERPLRPDQSARLAVHLSLCAACRGFAQQTALITELFRQHGATGLPVSDGLGAAARERIRLRLRERPTTA